MKHLTRIAGAAALLSLPARGAARAPVETLYHSALIRLESEVPDKRDDLGAAEPGTALAFRHLADRSGLLWLGFSAYGDTLTWNPADTLTLGFPGGLEVRAMEQFAMTPPLTQRIVPLAGPLRLGELWRIRPRSGGGALATVIFAGFPRVGSLERPLSQATLTVKPRSQGIPESHGR